VRPVDLAAFFAAIAKEGARPAPHAVEAIEQDGMTYRREAAPAADVSASDRAAFYQLKTMMQGVVQRGTARALAPLAPYVAGKTGTTEGQNDAWFVGFTNDITVAVWVGYDNAGDARRTLGEGATGAVVAAPIFESIVEAAWSHGMAKSVLAPPSPEAKSRLSCPTSDRDSGASRRPRTAEDCLRLDEKGRTIEARYRLVPRGAAYARRNTDEEDSTRNAGSFRPPWGEQGGYSAYGNGNAGHQGDGGRNWFGGWGRGFWNW
jgi:membrane peptidoglycan carboxypeptidase